jgi:hypothetical protein
MLRKVAREKNKKKSESDSMDRRELALIIKGVVTLDCDCLALVSMWVVLTCTSSNKFYAAFHTAYDYTTKIQILKIYIVT